MPFLKALLHYMCGAVAILFITISEGTMSISWSKKWDSTDDGSLVYGAELGTMQDDIDAGLTGTLPTPGVTDGLKLPRVKSDHSGYELVALVPANAGGTGADLSAGTAGYAVVSAGTALALAPLYHAAEVAFLADSAAQTVYTVSPITGVVSAVYANTHITRNVISCRYCKYVR